MYPNSSSIFSSDAVARRGALATAASILLWLLVADVGLGVVVGTPDGGSTEKTSPFVRYFDYGRSIEGKVRAMAGADGGKLHPLVETGWIAPAAPDQPAAPGADEDLLIAGYGMSFAAQILHRMADLDPRLAVRFGGGPGAPLSHSYAMYAADRGHHEARVVVLGILASSLPALVTVSHMTWNFEVPSPHFYPRYRLVDNRLAAHVPSVMTLAQLQAALADPLRWETLVAEIAAH